MIREIRSYIEAMEAQETLYAEANFSARAAALDFLEFHVLDRIEGMLLNAPRSEALADLKRNAEAAKTRLERVDDELFRELRQDIASGNCTGAQLKQRITEYAYGASGGGSQAGGGYDDLDVLVGGLLLAEEAPQRPRLRDPEMVFYQPTPVRIVLEMVEAADLRQHDVFYDIGSGLGQVCILVHLLTGVRAKGVEVEPDYCDYARRCARGLNLSQVRFVNQDAREADYADGTVFFLYTPFKGGALQRVLERLRHESKSRRIRLCTYGPCTPYVAQQTWLERLDHDGDQEDRLAVFRTRESAPDASEQLPEAHQPAGSPPLDSG